MKFKTYIFKIKHDTGNLTLTVTAKNKKSAVNLIMISEKCPVQAIQSFNELKKGLRK